MNTSRPKGFFFLTFIFFSACKVTCEYDEQNRVYAKYNCFTVGSKDIACNYVSYDYDDDAGCGLSSEYVSKPFTYRTIFYRCNSKRIDSVTRRIFYSNHVKVWIYNNDQQVVKKYRRKSIRAKF